MESAAGLFELDQPVPSTSEKPRKEYMYAGNLPNSLLAIAPATVLEIQFYREVSTLIADLKFFIKKYP